MTNRQVSAGITEIGNVKQAAKTQHIGLNDVNFKI